MTSLILLNPVKCSHSQHSLYSYTKFAVLGTGLVNCCCIPSMATTSFRGQGKPSCTQNSRGNLTKAMCFLSPKSNPLVMKANIPFAFQISKCTCDLAFSDVCTSKPKCFEHQCSVFCNVHLQFFYIVFAMTLPTHSTCPYASFAFYVLNASMGS